MRIWTMLAAIDDGIANCEPALAATSKFVRNLIGSVMSKQLAVCYVATDHAAERGEFLRVGELRLFDNLGNVTSAVESEPS